ncbi:MAG: hypothetical protein KDJ77_10465 [Rhodobiaceae bacterium]|nr:hypothetical protein [Rhodobiaceae bacterium]
MQTNPMKAAVSRGEAQLGTWVNQFRDPAMLLLLQAAGFDFARVDMEHTGASIETIEAMALVARAIGFPIVVRPPKANREWITRLLDIGVWNLHCPQVENAAHAREIVQASRYAPMGLRGQGGLGGATAFRKAPAADRRANANDQVFVTVMFETGRAFDDLDEIAAMPGIDAMTLGPADLSQDLGVSGTPEERATLDARRDAVVAAARRHGKTTAMLVNTAEEFRHWRDEGALLLAYSNEVEIIHDAFAQITARLRG